MPEEEVDEHKYAAELKGHLEDAFTQARQLNPKNCIMTSKPVENATNLEMQCGY